MKPFIQTLILFSVLFGLSNCKKNTRDIVYDKKYIKQIKAVRKEMVFYLASNNIPGASVAVMKDGKLIYSEGMGLASKDLEVPVTRKTKFRIGGLSELFTSFIYLRMVEDGTLHPDSSIQHYMPEFPEKKLRIELNDLANQMSGIREPNQKEADWRGLNVTIQKGLNQFKNDPLQSTPGRFQTNNPYQYNLLGAIMEKAGNKTFGKLLKEYVTDTLKLTHTQIDNPFMTIKGRSDFFDHNFISQLVNATFRDMRYRAPSQGLLSNAEDLAIFGNAVINSNLLSEKTKASMFEPALLFDDIPSTIANGWILLTDRSGNEFRGKVSSVTGGSAAILVIPNNNVVITFASNLTSDLDDTLVFDIAKHFITEKKETGDHE